MQKHVRCLQNATDARTVHFPPPTKATTVRGAHTHTAVNTERKKQNAIHYNQTPGLGGTTTKKQKKGGTTLTLPKSRSLADQAGATSDSTQGLWLRWTDVARVLLARTAACQSRDASAAIWLTPARNMRSSTTAQDKNTGETQNTQSNRDTDPVDVGIAWPQPRVDVLYEDVHDKWNANRQQQC